MNTKKIGNGSFKEALRAQSMKAYKEYIDYLATVDMENLMKDNDPNRRPHSKDKKEPLCMEDTLDFGKHAEEQIEDILQDDPQYLVWMYNNDVRQFEQDVIDALAERKLI